MASKKDLLRDQVKRVYKAWGLLVIEHYSKHQKVPVGTTFKINYQERGQVDVKMYLLGSNYGNWITVNERLTKIRRELQKQYPSFAGTGLSNTHHDLNEIVDEASVDWAEKQLASCGVPRSYATYQYTLETVAPATCTMSITANSPEEADEKLKKENKGRLTWYVSRDKVKSADVHVIKKEVV